ncbi:MAG: DUF3383 domain-containing protein [Sphingomonadales bacterium]|nr:DUF3383 domain-containing protein [Sphingomonadales bacterium]
MTSIPASAIVNVLPNVITAGGSGLDLVGLFLTNNTQVPTGAVLSFANKTDVATYFGATSTEAGLAATYFAGYDGSTIKPAKLLFYRYATAAVPAWLRGGNVGAGTLAAIQALSGTLTISVNGTNKTSGAIDLSTATSFSNAATIIQAAFTAPGFTVAFDSVSGGFVFTNTSTGVTSTIAFAATGALATGLKLTQAIGAVVSQGSDAMTPAAAMNTIIGSTQDFVSFATVFAPTDSDKLAFAAWVNAQPNRYLYVCWDANTAATNPGDTSSFGALVKADAYSAVVAIYDPANGVNVAAFLMGAIASVNFGAKNGRATMAFRTGAVIPGVTNQSTADNLKANGYNFIGAYATANDGFVFFYPGQVSGPFEWIDSWIGQVWMNNAFQLSLMSLLTSIGSIPYNDDGKALIASALRDQIDAALNFGAIREGVPLSAEQKAKINYAAGGNIADTVEQRGWYVLVGDASAQVRSARGSPPINVWYTDGQSVQQINLASVLVQ